ERHNLLGGELPQPFTVEAQRSPRRVEYLVQLCCIRPGIYQNVISRERLAGFGFPRRITDHPGKITDDQNHLMAEFLKLSQLMQDDGVPKMDIRRSRVEAELDP